MLIRLQMAKRRLQRMDTTSFIPVESFYVASLAVRAVPADEFMKRDVSPWPLPITSMSEDRLLRESGISRAERIQIECLQTTRTVFARQSVYGASSLGLSEEELSTRAIVRLARDPPLNIGRLQRRTAQWLVRPYRAPSGIEPKTARWCCVLPAESLVRLPMAALGFRFSGKNMSPLPGWLAGAQSVA